MNATEFNELFDEVFFKPLNNQGAKFVRKSRTIRILRDDNDLRLVRLGGRLTRQGSMATQIVFRHKFLRSVTDDNLGDDELEVSDFPRKLIFGDFRGVFRTPRKYEPRLTGPTPIDYFTYSDGEAPLIERKLIKLRKAFEKRVIPWAMSLTPESELKEIVKHGQNAWCERIWIEDYKRHMKEKAG